MTMTLPLTGTWLTDLLALMLLLAALGALLVMTPLGTVMCGFWQPRRQEQAKLIDLRAEYIATDRSGHEFYRYHAWFTLADGRQVKLRIPEKEYQAMHCGDRGVLTHRGGWFRAFHVTQPAADVQAIFRDHE